MRKTIIFIGTSAIALASAYLGYTLVAGPPTEPAQAAPAPPPVDMPDEFHILYLAPEGTQRGLLNDEIIAAQGISAARSWEDARSTPTTPQGVAARRVDAVLVDASFTESASDRDREWLQSLYHNGTVMVGLGVDDDEFARALGRETFRTDGENFVPIGPTGYRITHMLVLGHPDDIAREPDWIDRVTSGREPSAIIQNPMTRSYGAGRGELSSEQDVLALFKRVHLNIMGIYEVYVEYQLMVQNFEESQ